MGSYYGTCGISQLPIIDNERVALFILERNKMTEAMTNAYINLGGGITCSDDLYKPIAIPVYGEYADYGIIKNIEDINDTVLNHLKTLEIKSYEEDYEVTDLLTFIEDVERGKIDNFSFMLIHEELMNNLVKDFGDRKTFYTKDETLKDSLLTGAEDLLNLIISHDLRHTDFVSKDYKDFQFYESDTVLKNTFARATSKNHKYYRNPEVLSSRLITNEVVNFLILTAFMEDTRKLWIPQAGAGSQSTHYKHLDIINQFAKLKEKQMNEW